jgi:hypothetical protein
LLAYRLHVNGHASFIILDNGFDGAITWKPVEFVHSGVDAKEHDSRAQDISDETNRYFVLTFLKFSVNDNLKITSLHSMF